MFHGWKHELDFLKRSCNARDAPVLPAVVLEWFDLNRNDVAPSSEYVADLFARIAEAAKTHSMDDWRLHTDAYGWRLMLQPYRRVADGPRYYLLRATRPTKATDKDRAQLDRLLKYLGFDPEGHFLMETRLDTDPDIQDFWTRMQCPQ